jgi:hypothetical protein
VEAIAAVAIVEAETAVTLVEAVAAVALVEAVAVVIYGKTGTTIDCRRPEFAAIIRLAQVESRL